MKTLHLTITKKWFDMILSGEKTEEYREIKDYWTRRLVWIHSPNRIEVQEVTNELAHGNHEIIDGNVEFAFYQAIEFRNGYSKDAPTTLVERKGITTGIGYPRWGAPSHPVFIIKLGKVIETKNLKTK